MSAVIVAPDVVRHRMRAGEWPCWIGRPDPRSFAVAKGAAGFLIGIPYTAAAAHFTYGAVASEVDPLGSLAGALLVVTGLGLLASPLWFLLAASRTLYVATNRRLIVLSGVVRRTARSFEPGEIGRIERRESDDGSGSLVFRRERHRTSEGGWYSKRFGFFAIPDVREAERHVAALKDRRSAGSSAPSLR